ncbi:MAG: yaiO, partial [Chitinophagaceae bacterium]|nr:yaiO [Chitinophagaceae bacterium]
MSMLKKILSLSLILVISLVSNAQKKTTSDDLLRAAQKSAFQQKDYNSAKKMLQAALKKQPDYSDVRIFLGRIYTWTNNYDSARIAFEYVLKRHPAIEDVAVAYSDLNVYHNNFTQALSIINNGLKYHPASETLLLKKARIEGAIKNYAAADSTLQRLLNINPKNGQVDSLRHQYQQEANAATLPPVPTADELLVTAKDAAFNQKDYNKAKQLLLQALNKNPEYYDVRIFLGRI